VIRLRDLDTYHSVFRDRVATFIVDDSVRFVGTAAFPFALSAPPAVQSTLLLPLLRDSPDTCVDDPAEPAPSDSDHPHQPVNDWRATPFSAKVMLKTLELSHKMKNSADISDVVILAAELSLDTHSFERLLAEIKSGKVVR